MTLSGQTAPTIQWIVSDEQLVAAAERWQQRELLAVDTEFMRSDTYYPIAGLIQINDGHVTALIDPLSIKDFTPLSNILTDKQVLKVFHACSEDIEVFRHLTGHVPAYFIDTQIAAAFCGYGVSLGYSKLVALLESVELPKGETRSDWLQRPLRETQIAYAALDVQHLYSVAKRLIEELNTLQRLAWILEDCARMTQVVGENQAPSASYLRIKSAWRLSPRQLHVLKGLSSWREQAAQERDLPRNNVLKENVLLSIAQKVPKNLASLKALGGMSEHFINHDGAALIHIIREAANADPESFPTRLPAPLNEQQRKTLKQLKAQIADFSSQQNLPAELLLRKADYQRIIRAKYCNETAVPEELVGWRRALLAPLLNQFLST